jgi:type IV pilus assembly protein PilW
MKRTHGFTLLEMMIALAVSVTTITAVLVVVQSQQRVFQAGVKVRQAQATARSALLFLERKVPLAGFGMDPAEALDFQWYGCASGPSSCPRDRTDAPDELVFYARNPAYRVVESDTAPTAFYGKAWQGSSLDATTLVLEARQGEIFPKGQIYQMACANELRFTHVTVSATTTAPADGKLELPLEAASPASLSSGTTADPFRRQDAANPSHADFKKWNACFASSPRVFQIDRYRFYVRPVQLGTTNQYDPFLVLDQGIDRNADGTIDEDDEQLIAQGIENFQVAYGFLDPSIPPAGRTPGTAITVPNPGATADQATEVIVPTDFPGKYDATTIFPFLQSSQFFIRSSAPLADSRRVNHQGNIRTIQIAVVARSSEPDPGGISNLKYADGSPLWVMNFNKLPTWISAYAASQGGDDRYARAVATTALEIPNAASRGLMPN